MIVPYKFELKDSDYLKGINADSFDDIALQLFQHQYHNNVIYRQFTDALKIAPASVTSVHKIPFLPTPFFKTYKVLTGTALLPELIFESSGTTGDIPSRHYVADATIYEASLLAGFRAVHGDPSRYAILALLPSYLERSNASLVHMAKVLMRESAHPDNGFYLDEWGRLADILRQLEAQKQPVLLLGVTFALLDFAEKYPMQLQHTIVMETGGMKGRREEWTRTQVHEYLQRQWQLTQVHSEYGMTELLSQAYATSNGIFEPSASMKVLVRDINDPLDVQLQGSGCLNIIDLANIHSCAFIATEDIGKLNAGGSFEVLGRVDHAALRGCSLMVL
jgi:phenylacetate-coenzyme A ligase PaaK-like adenylate-forming protein